MSVTGVRVSLFTMDMLMFDNVDLPEMKPVPHSGQNGAILSVILIKIAPELKMF
jgi:hypothetical protein